MNCAFAMGTVSNSKLILRGYQERARLACAKQTAPAPHTLDDNRPWRETTRNPAPTYPKPTN
jgi:hypothetical protein